jgi:hypothetical protein
MFAASWRVILKLLYNVYLEWVMLGINKKMEVQSTTKYKSECVD